MLSVPDYVAPNPTTRVCKLLLNIRSNNPTLLTLIASVQTSTTLRNDFKQTVDTLQSSIGATNITTSQNKEFLLWQEEYEVEEDVVTEDVVVVVTISKANGHTRMYTEDAEELGDMVVQINVCSLTTKEIHPKELIGWRISYMNQVFMPSLRQNRRPDYMNYSIAEVPPPL